MTSAVLRALPWALPGTMAAICVSALIAGPLSRRTATSAPLTFLLLWSVGGYLAVTASPGSGAGYWGGSRSVSWVPAAPSPAHLLRLTESSLNFWLTVPLGVFALLAAAASRRWWLGLAALLPIAAEGFQWALPVLGRSGFLLSDVMLNWFGVAAGLVVGLMLWPLSRAATLPSGR